MLLDDAFEVAKELGLRHCRVLGKRILDDSIAAPFQPSFYAMQQHACGYLQIVSSCDKIKLTPKQFWKN